MFQRERKICLYRRDTDHFLKTLPSLWATSVLDEDTCIASTVGALPVSPQQFLSPYTLTCASMTLFMRAFESREFPHPMHTKLPEALRDRTAPGEYPQEMTDRRYLTNSHFWYFLIDPFPPTAHYSPPLMCFSQSPPKQILCTHSLTSGSNCRVIQPKILCISMFLYNNTSLTPSGIPM